MGPLMGRLADRAYAWWQLLRGANAPTAASNVIAASLVVTGEWQPIRPLLLLVAASVLLYEAGMVLNDVFDAEEDRIERPERPIPSGRIARGPAMLVGWSLLAAGVGCAWLTSWTIGAVAPAVVGSCLAIAVVLYDAGLKQSWAGPLAMGWCRLLNVLLGASIAADRWADSGIWWIACGMGAYTVLLTITAARETAKTKQAKAFPYPVPLTLATFMLFYLMSQGRTLCIHPAVWGGMWAALACYVALSLHGLKSVESPATARHLVTKLILLFIVIDAVIATGAAGWIAGLVVLSLLVPTLLASKWVAMT